LTTELNKCTIGHVLEISVVKVSVVKIQQKIFHKVVDNAEQRIYNLHIR